MVESTLRMTHTQRDYSEHLRKGERVLLGPWPPQGRTPQDTRGPVAWLPGE